MTMPSGSPSTGRLARPNLQTLGKLALLAALMFGFGFAMVPLYKKLCEVTGINSLTRADDSVEQFARNTQVDTTRKVVVEFDANGRGPWRFRPERASVEVHPGELVTVNYELLNTEPRAMAGQAIPSYAPQVSAQYFRKLECFCFRQQALEANETRRFPVVFVVDPELPREVGTITLSYTFFEVGAGVRPADASAAPAAARRAGGDS
jgi:cytochrome c oxidase assembly protein subunit 11